MSHLAHQPYPAYRPSGVPWLGNVPAHWGVRRLRSVADMRVSNVDKQSKADELPVRLCNYVDVYKNDRITADLPFMSATATPDEIERFRLELGDVLITKDSEAWNDIGVPALVEHSARNLVCGYHLALLRPIDGRLNSAYLYRSLQSAGIAYQFHVAAGGVTRYGLTHDDIKSVILLLPPSDEQAAIVRYLNHADDLISRYICAKERLIVLLEEQRQAVVDQVITRGLNSSVEMVQSGVNPLDQVPKHWRKRRLKEVASIQQGITIGPHRNEPGLLRRPYLRVANVQAGHLDLGQVITTGVSPAEISRSTLRVGDVLMTEGGDIDKLGRGCIWQGEIPDCMHQNHVFAVRPDASLLNPAFLVTLMGSSRGRDYFYVTAKQTTNLAATNRNTLGNFPIHLPSVAEQQTIVNELDLRSAATNAVIAQTRRQIDTIHEYRTRLIADAVTGQIDVRCAVVELPD